MKKEYTFIAIIGMFLLAYLLDAVVEPLKIQLATPYDYFAAGHANRFPFTSASILIRSLAIVLSPLILTTFINRMYYAKGATLLIFSALIQLYAVQDVVSGAHVVPLEWAISLAAGGAGITLLSILFLIRGALDAAHQSMLKAVTPPPPPPGSVRSPEWLAQNPPPKTIPKKSQQ